MDRLGDAGFLDQGRGVSTSTPSAGQGPGVNGLTMLARSSMPTEVFATIEPSTRRASPPDAFRRVRVRVDHRTRLPAGARTSRGRARDPARNRRRSGPARLRARRNGRGADELDRRAVKVEPGPREGAGRRKIRVGSCRSFELDDGPERHLLTRTTWAAKKRSRRPSTTRSASAATQLRPRANSLRTVTECD